MRFIVEVFRVLVLGLLALLLIGAAFVGFTLAIGGFAVESSWVSPPMIGIVAAVVFGLGLLAMFIAIHDRLCEIASPLRGAHGDEPSLYADGEPSHGRTGLLVMAGGIALGGALAASVHFAAPSAGAGLEAMMARNEPAPMPLADAAANLAPDATPTPKDDNAKESDDKAEPDKTPTNEAIPEGVTDAAPPMRYRATSVFGPKQRGSLACRIPGQDAFVVEWNAGADSAVAHFANARIQGAMQQRANAANTIESALQFSLEDGGHSLSLAINDGGAMRASVDGRESTGTCSPG